MDKIKFLDKIKAMKLTEFEFVNFEKTISSPDAEGERMEYLVLTLAESLPFVQSSHRIVNSRNRNEQVFDGAEDVVEVRVKMAILEKYLDEFEFDMDKDENLTKTGRYAGNLIMDVSKNQLVWLTDEKLANQGREFMNKKQDERLQHLMAKAKGMIKK